jgi:hypothetical protein
METKPRRGFTHVDAQKLHLGNAGLEKNPLHPSQSKGERNILTRGRELALLLLATHASRSAGNSAAATAPDRDSTAKSASEGATTACA